MTSHSSGQNSASYSQFYRQVSISHTNVVFFCVFYLYIDSRIDVFFGFNLETDVLFFKYQTFLCISYRVGLMCFFKWCSRS